MNQYYNDKLSFFLAEVNFDTSEGKQLSYFQIGYFFKILFMKQKIEFKIVLISIGQTSYKFFNRLNIYYQLCIALLKIPPCATSIQ